MNTNRDIAEVLRDVVAKKGAELRAMTDTEAKQKLRFGIRAIDSAADQIDALDWQLTDPAHALNIPGVGKKIAARVAEFLRTGRLRELDGFQVDRGEVVPRELLTVYGIGPERAQALAQEGIITVDLLKRAVRRKLVAVPGSTERALQYHDELQQKIPRTEMKDFQVLLQGITEQVAPGATAMVLGSYRRGAKASSDIDLLVTRPRNVQGLLQDVVRALSAEGLVRACLSSAPAKDTADRDEGFSGVAPRHHRAGCARCDSDGLGLLQAGSQSVLGHRPPGHASPKRARPAPGRGACPLRRGPCEGVPQQR